MPATSEREGDSPTAAQQREEAAREAHSVYTVTHQPDEPGGQRAEARGEGQRERSPSPGDPTAASRLGPPLDDTQGVGLHARLSGNGEGSRAWVRRVQVRQSSGGPPERGGALPPPAAGADAAPQYLAAPPPCCCLLLLPQAKTEELRRMFGLPADEQLMDGARGVGRVERGTCSTTLRLPRPVPLAPPPSAPPPPRRHWAPSAPRGAPAP